MRVALDTNILAYAEGIGPSSLRDQTTELIKRLPPEYVLLPVQALGELYRILVGKAKRPPKSARTSVLQWADIFDIADSTWSAFQSAFDLAGDHDLQVWDALIFSVAAENGCRILLSEDLQHGFTWRGVIVVNPYRLPSHPLLSSLLLR